MNRTTALALAMLFSLIAPAPSRADVVLVGDIRSVAAYSEVGPTPVIDQDTSSGPGEFEVWTSTASALSIDSSCIPISCIGGAGGYQYSGIYPFSIFGRLESSCGLSFGSGTLRGDATQTTTFQILSCQEYQLSDSTTAGTGGTGSVRISHLPINGFTPVVLDLDAGVGNISLDGRLAPGDYELYVSSSTGEQSSSITGPSIFYTLSFQDCPASIIATQPVSAEALPGASVQFSVGASASARGAALTYQWQRNQVDLADGGRISGAMSSTLTIMDVQPGDAGVYGVVASDGSVSEPSSYAALTLADPTGVAVASADPGLALLAAAPNPFCTETAFRYSLPTESSVLLEVFDVAGRRVRTLVDRPRAGAGIYETRWRGDREDGTPGAAGVYFVRLAAGGRLATQRVVLLGNPR